MKDHVVNQNQLESVLSWFKNLMSSNSLEARGIIKQIGALHKLLHNFLMLHKLGIEVQQGMIGSSGGLS
jgi:hypothetical protein